MTESERYTIVNALRLAAERYREHATTLRTIIEGGNHVGQTRLVEQFALQAQQATDLADRIEQGEDL
jgi:hypothetical protein